MGGDNRGLAADPPRPSRESSPRAKKRRRGSIYRKETPRESSCSKRKYTPSSRPIPLMPPHLFALWPLRQPGDVIVPPGIGSVSMVPYHYPPLTTHYQPSSPSPSIVWPPMPTTTCMGIVTIPTRAPAPSLSVNDNPTGVRCEKPGGAPLPATGNASFESQRHPTSGATYHTPRLEDLPDPPADQRPSQTIRVLASAALRSELKGKLSLEEIVHRICSRFDHFRGLQNRTKLKVRLLLSTIRC
jgi:hypothetical protein